MSSHRWPTFSELEKLNKATVAARLKEIKGNKDFSEEVSLLNAWLEFSSREADLKRAVKGAEADLDSRAYAKYPTLKEADVQTLVVGDKWLAALESAIHGEMDRISQVLTLRVKELAERYETPLPAMARRAAELEHAVEQHLQHMGFSWKLSPAIK